MAPIPGIFLTAKLRCGLPDIAGDRPSAGMISDYCDFTMSSAFSATGQLLDLKRAGDRKLARVRRRSLGLAVRVAFIVMRPQTKYSMGAFCYCTAYIAVIDAEKIDQ